MFEVEPDYNILIRRIARHLAESRNWGPETVGDLTLIQALEYCDDAELDEYGRRFRRSRV